MLSDWVSYKKFDYHDCVKSLTPLYQCVTLTAFKSLSLDSEEDDILGKDVELNSRGGSSTNMSNAFFELNDDEFHI